MQLARWNQWLRAIQARYAVRGAKQRSRSLLTQPPVFNTDSNHAAQMLVMDRMHKIILRETARRQALERAMRVTQSELAQARADLDRVKHGARQARHQALHDELTDLPNRRHLLQRLGNLLTQHKACEHGPTVLFIDLDNFKAVNDTHGHGVGDEVLRITAARLSAAVRQGDLVVRMGGDEFACVLRGVSDAAPLHQLCEKLLQVLCSPMKISDLQLLVRPSIGVAICPQHGTQAEALLVSADAAMYAAKRDRRGYAFATADGAGIAHQPDLHP